MTVTINPAIGGGFSGVAGSGATIGSLEFMPPTGNQYTKADGSVWLQTGQTVSTATAPVAATLTHMMVNGTVGSITSSAITGLASDPTGTYWVAAYGNGTNVLVSSNSGSTWSTVAHGLGMNATGAAYGSGNFVVCGNSTSAVATSTSINNGTSFTANSTTAVTSGVANSASIAFGNSLFGVVVGSAGGVGAVSTSSNSTTWTAQNTSLATASPAIVWSPSASLWIISSTTAANWLTSTTLVTAAYTQITGPTSTAVLLAANGTCAVASFAGTAYRSTNGSTWTTVTAPRLPFSPPNATLSMGIVRCGDGTNFFYSVSGNQTTTDNLFYVSTDCISFTRRWWTAGISASSQTALVQGAGSVVVGVPYSAAATSTISTTTYPNADTVGSSMPQYSAFLSTNAAAGLIAYLRIT